MARFVYCVFDVHLWSQAFVPADFNKHVHFLWAPADYRAMRDKGDKIEFANLVLFPLKDEFDPGRNHLWPRFRVVADNLPDNQPAPAEDTREFVWPLRCRPKNLDLTLNDAVWGVRRKVRSTIWLWSFGWSSQIEIEMPAPDNFDGLAETGIKLRQREAKPLLLHGKPATVADALSHLAELVRLDLRAPGSKALDSIRLARHVVCAFEAPKGFNIGRNVSMGSQMSLIGAVRGQEMDPAKFLNNRPLFTPLGEGNFAVTDFDAGTAIVQRHWQDRPGTKLESNHCFYVNTRNFMAMFLALHRLIAQRTLKSKTDARAKAAASILAAFPVEYQNRLCSDFASKFAPRPQPAADARDPAPPAA